MHFLLYRTNWFFRNNKLLAEVPVKLKKIFFLNVHFVTKIEFLAYVTPGYPLVPPHKISANLAQPFGKL